VEVVGVGGPLRILSIPGAISCHFAATTDGSSSGPSLMRRSRWKGALSPAQRGSCSGCSSAARTPRHRSGYTPKRRGLRRRVQGRRHVRRGLDRAEAVTVRAADGRFGDPLAVGGSDELTLHPQKPMARGRRETPRGFSGSVATLSPAGGTRGTGPIGAPGPCSASTGRGAPGGFPAVGAPGPCAGPGSLCLQAFMTPFAPYRAVPPARVQQISHFDINESAPSPTPW